MKIKKVKATENLINLDLSEEEIRTIHSLLNVEILGSNTANLNIPLKKETVSNLQEKFFQADCIITRKK